MLIYLLTIVGMAANEWRGSNVHVCKCL